MVLFESVNSGKEGAGDKIGNTDMNSNTYTTAVDDEDTDPPVILITNEEGRKVNNKRLKSGMSFQYHSS